MAARPLYDDPPRAPRPSRTRAAAAEPPQARPCAAPVAPIVVPSCCLALLGVGRVTLSFAVVQKSLQTGVARYVSRCA